MIRVSIIIPTYHRKEFALRLVKELHHQYIQQSEIIIVEQKDNNEKLFTKYGRYIYLSNPSTAHAMNVGVKAAQGTYIVFFDDDVSVMPGCINYHIRCFSDTHVAATVGRVITNGQVIEASRRDVGRINWLGLSTDGFSSLVKQPVDTVIGCNTCWRKDVYVTLGGIDEQFTGNAMRLETDLSLRAKNAGYTIVFEPQAAVKHLRAKSGGARKTEGRIQWYFDFFSNETYFFLKHRPAILLPIFLLMKLNWALRCMFGFGREVSMRSICTPKFGILDGIKKYRRYIHENRH